MEVPPRVYLHVCILCDTGTLVWLCVIYHLMSVKLIHLCQYQYNSTHITLIITYHELSLNSYHLSTRLLICSLHFVTAFIDLTIIPISCLGVNWESKGLPGLKR